MIKFVSDQIQNFDKNLTQANAYSKKLIFTIEIYNQIILQ